MFQGSKKAIILFMSACWLMLACGLTDSLGLTGTSATPTWPQSTFVPHKDELIVDLEEQVVIESHHMSKNRFGSLEIMVNRQPAAEGESTSVIFDDTLASVELATIKVLAPTTEYADGVCIGEVCDELITTVVSVTSEPIMVYPVQSEYPNDTWTVFVMWTGHVPGTYDLSMIVTDNAGNRGERITQRLEVKESSP